MGFRRRIFRVTINFSTIIYFYIRFREIIENFVKLFRLNQIELHVIFDGSVEELKMRTQLQRRSTEVREIKEIWAVLKTSSHLILPSKKHIIPIFAKVKKLDVTKELKSLMKDK